MSWMCVSRFTPCVARWCRSPSPVSGGVKKSNPPCRSSRAKGVKVHPPRQPPGTRTIVVMKPRCRVSPIGKTVQRFARSCVTRAVPGGFPAHEQYLVDVIGVDQSRDKCEISLEAHAQRHEHAVVPPHGTFAVMRKKPHAHIHKVGRFRSHPIGGALLHPQSVLRELVQQALRFVPAPMPDEVVEGGPTRRMQWHG